MMNLNLLEPALVLKVSGSEDGHVSALLWVEEDTTMRKHRRCRHCEQLVLVRWKEAKVVLHQVSNTVWFCLHEISKLLPEIFDGILRDCQVELLDGKAIFKRTEDT